MCSKLNVSSISNNVCGGSGSAMFSYKIPICAQYKYDMRTDGRAGCVWVSYAASQMLRRVAYDITGINIVIIIVFIIRATWWGR